MGYRYVEIRNHMADRFFSFIHDPHRRPQKWSPSQTLLEMAIRCGQLDATRFLSHAHCEATSLTADDLIGPMFQGTRVGDISGQVYDVTINRDAACAEAARLAYHLSRNRYQVLIVQMSDWWSRPEQKARNVTCALTVKWAGLVDTI